MNEAQKHAENLRDLLPHNDYWGEDDHKIAAAADYIESLTRERDEWRRRWHETYDREERFRDERDELRRILDEASHEEDCRTTKEYREAFREWQSGPQISGTAPTEKHELCDCFKSRVPQA